MTTPQHSRFIDTPRRRVPQREQSPGGIDPDFDADREDLEEQFAALRRLTF